MNPEEIKDVNCTMCGRIVPEDELHEADHDWGICETCADSKQNKTKL